MNEFENEKNEEVDDLFLAEGEAETVSKPESAAGSEPLPESRHELRRMAEEAEMTETLAAPKKNRVPVWARCLIAVLSVISALLLATTIFLLVSLNRTGVIPTPGGGFAANVSGERAEDGVGIYNRATMEKLMTLSRYIDTYYLYDIDEEAMRDALAHALFNSLDETYTHYFSAEEYAELQADHTTGYYGIGISIASGPNGEVNVINVMYDSPAERAGILINDQITAINGTSTIGMETSEVAGLIASPEIGTPVQVTVYRPSTGETIVFDMAVDAVNYSYVSYDSIGTEHPIGYIKLNAFSDVSAEQFERAFGILRDEGMQALILDLRFNTGGSLDALVSIANTFLPEGEIIRIDYTASGSTTYSSSGENYIEGMPIIVLVNEYTASASEALCGAIRDMGVGTLLGTQTFGKGIVQSTYEFNDGSAIKLTTAYYYTPNGTCIQGEGFTPDEVVELDVAGGYDNQLERALELMCEALGTELEDYLPE